MCRLSSESDAHWVSSRMKIPSETCTFHLNPVPDPVSIRFLPRPICFRFASEKQRPNSVQTSNVYRHFIPRQAHPIRSFMPHSHSFASYESTRLPQALEKQHPFQISPHFLIVSSVHTSRFADLLSLSQVPGTSQLLPTPRTG